MAKKNKIKSVKNNKSKKSGSGGGVVKYPAKILRPVGEFLQARLKMLEKRKRDVEEEDPFADPDRVNNNASPDTDAAEQFGHARTSAIKEQLDRKIIQTRKALTRIKVGKYGVCEKCGKMIDTDRLVVYPEATLCAKDAAKEDKKV
jgi:DnaK suppressor protein